MYAYAANPFFQAYIHSDLLGKAIFLSLIALSVISWNVAIYKTWLTLRVRALSAEFRTLFLKQKSNPLVIEAKSVSEEVANPFLSLYQVLIGALWFQC